MKRKSIGLLVAIAMMVVSFSVPAYAQAVEPESSNAWTLETFETGQEYLLNVETGEKIAQVFAYDENGILIEVELEEHLQKINSMPRIVSNNVNTEASRSNETESGNNSTRVGGIWVDVFKETRTYVGLGDSYKVTADLRGPGNISHFNAKSISHTFGGEVSISGTIKKAIEVGASFDWHTSLSSETSNGYSYDVPSGKIGYIRFTPYLDVTVGDLYNTYVAPFIYEEFYKGEVWGACPIEIAGGFADGLFELMLY